MPGTAYAALADRLSEASAADHPFVSTPGLTLEQHEAAARLLHDLSAAMRAFEADPDGAPRLSGLLGGVSEAIFAMHLADNQ